MRLIAELTPQQRFLVLARWQAADKERPRIRRDRSHIFVFRGIFIGLALSLPAWIFFFAAIF